MQSRYYFTINLTNAFQFEKYRSNDILNMQNMHKCIRFHSTTICIFELIYYLLKIYSYLIISFKSNYLDGVEFLIHGYLDKYITMDNFIFTYWSYYGLWSSRVHPMILTFLLNILKSFRIVFNLLYFSLIII